MNNNIYKPRTEAAKEFIRRAELLWESNNERSTDCSDPELSTAEALFLIAAQLADIKESIHDLNVGGIRTMPE